MKYEVNENGYYGRYGGAFIPEILHRNIEAVTEGFRMAKADPSFLATLETLLSDYVGRPSPLYYARNLSERLGTGIYLKREDLNHTGAHKINNAIGQLLLAKRLGKKRISAETGAGQHGVAVATACALMGMQCVIYMGQKDMCRQASNVQRMRLLGAAIVPVTSGSATLKDATNEAIRNWISQPEDTYYLIGSVVGPAPYPEMVTFFQSIISLEIRKQLAEKTGRPLPDAVVACIGGGSNAAGAFHHFLDEDSVRLIGVEASGKGVHSGHTAATLAMGSPGVIHGSATYLLQSSDGQVTEPYSISAGLDYPGIGPLHAHLYDSGRAGYLHVTDEQALSAGRLLTKLEGIIPALETAHALGALKQLAFGPKEIVVVCLSGRGDKDLDTYNNNGHEQDQ
ncbi:MAG: tryptophan synthase subunit beta [Sphingobacteriales bacterium]|nr:MAG: tryptophan synthase subunit beta [Sphingobacteriales bacterium]